MTLNFLTEYQVSLNNTNQTKPNIDLYVTMFFTCVINLEKILFLK